MRNTPTNLFSRYLKYLKILKRIIIKKPIVLVRTAVNYFRIFVLRENIVRKVEMGVTFGCPLGCAKCSSDFMYNPQGEKLTFEQIRDAAKQMLKLGALQINFTGGEPLVAENFFEIIKCFQPHKFVVTINTSGLLLNENMIDRLEEAGVDIIKISIDSPIEEEHDKARTVKGSFKKATHALAYIKKKGVILGQISTVTIKENLNSDRIWKLVDMAKDYDASLGLTIPAASGRWVDNKDILLGDKEREVLNRIIKLPHVIRDTDEAYVKSNCPAGSEEFYLTIYGDIIPCPLIQLSFGNVKRESLSVIWKRMCDFEPFKSRGLLGCPAGEDRDFIEEYLAPLKNFDQRPVFIEDFLEAQKVFNVTAKDT